MTQFAGFTVVSGAEYADNNPHLSQELDTLDLWDWPPVPGAPASTVDCSTCPDSGIMEVSLEAQTGFVGDTAKAFSQDWYDTVHLLPNPIALGNLLSTQDRDFEVWNAYFTSQSLSSITPENAGGLTLQEPFSPPTDFSPLESRIYTLSVFTSGPSVIDGRYTFNFNSDAPILRVTGRRIIVFPFIPDWSRAFVERVEWFTQVLPHYGGSEQRVRGRQTPRQIFEYQVTLTGVDKQRFNSLLWGWQQLVFASPVWSDATALTAAASVDDTVLNVNTDDLAFEVGGLAVIYKDSLTYEAVEIASVSPTSIQTALGLLNDWSKHAVIVPAKVARITPNITQSLLNPDIYQGQVKFTTEFGDSFQGVDSVTTYRGLPVMDIPPYWHKPIDRQILRELQTLDNAIGVRTIDDPSDYSHSLQQYHWVKQGRAEITALREWVYARAGKLVPFWTSTFQTDLTVSSQISDADTQIEVLNAGYSAFVSQSVSRRDLRIELKNGTVFYRRVTDSADQGATESLTIDSALGETVLPSDIYMISFMYIARLDTDILEFSWLNPRLLELTAALRGLKYDV